MEQTPIDIVRSFADVPTLECVIYCVVFGSVWPNLTMDNSWNEKKHNKGGIKIYDKYDNIFRCKNAFTKFITIYDNLRPDKEISQFFGLHESKAKVELYKTKRENVTFIDEKDKDGDLIIHKFGEFLIDVGNKYDRSNREVEIKMKMGGTFISATAKYCKTGDTFKITCLYED